MGIATGQSPADIIDQNVGRRRFLGFREQRVNRPYLLPVFVCFLAVSVRPAAADPAPSGATDPTGMFNVDALIEQAVKNVSARYNLNEEQERVTRAMMFDGVRKFLETHKNDIWPLVRALSKYQFEGNLPEGEEAQRIGTAADPLIAEAEKAIFEANAKWREILSPEQKRLHDFDMRETKKTFSKVRENFDDWKKGKPKSASIFPDAPETLEGEPPPPTKPPSIERMQPDMWDRYVQNFIRRYELDDAQKTAANSILADCKERAADFRKTNADKFSALETAAKEAAGANDNAKVAEIAIETKRLNEPIVALYAELMNRLEFIPNEAQREKAGTRSAAKQARKQPTTAPAEPAATAKPAPTTAPAEPGSR
jgi:hypothetical protein